MMRLIESNDYYKNYMDLINIFTRNKQIKSYDEFIEILNIITKQNSEIYVIEEDGIIVSTLKILFEQKLHNNFARMGHIEDVVTLPAYRGRGYASSLIQKAIQRCKEKCCYKIILTSNIQNSILYEKAGFIQKDMGMVKYLDQN